jgi:hypothetical protein
MLDGGIHAADGFEMRPRNRQLIKFEIGSRLSSYLIDSLGQNRPA